MRLLRVFNAPIETRAFPDVSRPAIFASRRQRETVDFEIKSIGGGLHLFDNRLRDGE